MATTNFEFFDQFTAVSHDVLAEVMPQITAPVRHRIAERLVAAFMREWQGTCLYIPKTAHLERLQRNRAIANAHDGTLASANRLAQKYGLSLQAIYRIVKAQKTQPGTPAHPAASGPTPRDLKP